MSMSDLWHAPLVESTKVMSTERARFDSLGSEVVVGVGSDKVAQDGRPVEDGQAVEDGPELPNSQQKEEELPELSVEESRPAVVHVLVRGKKRGSGVHLHSPRTKRVKKTPARFID